VNVKRIFIVGAGTMGSGIAQVAAMSGYEVTLMDLYPEQLERAQASIRRSLDKLLEKEKITAQQYQSGLEFRSVTDLEGASSADLVIEAATETPELKLSLFNDLDVVTPPETILASNTSSISITRIAAATGRPEKVIGMHFMNPVPLMRLVEVVCGLSTGIDTCTIIQQVCRRMGKEPVEAKDSPGFISNRVLCPMINEAIFALQEGVGSVEAIDTVMKLGMNHPLGPLALADLIGLDTCLSILEVLHEGLGDDKYRPCPLLKRMVAAGQLGRKTGRGFYTYEK
jgi:3-hydroxybutyryl-CoA dehydrogenase